MLAVELAKRVGPQGKVIAIDISVEQLVIAKNYAEKHGVNNIEFVCLDVNSLTQIDKKDDSK